MFVNLLLAASFDVGDDGLTSDPLSTSTNLNEKINSYQLLINK